MEVAGKQTYVLGRDAAVRELWWLGGRIASKAEAAQTGGLFSQLLFTDPKGLAEKQPVG